MGNETGFKPSWEEIAAHLTTTPGTFDFFTDMAAEALKNEYRREDMLRCVNAMVTLTTGENPVEFVKRSRQDGNKAERDKGKEVEQGLALLGYLLFSATVEYVELNECEQQDSTVSFLQQTGYLMSKDVSAISNEELSNTITGLHMGEPA